MVFSYSDFRALDPSKYLDDVSPGRTATIVVAAFNSSLQSKAQADYVCAGTADEIEIGAAIAAATVVGGRVVLSEGTFNCEGFTIDHCTAEGQGAGIRLGEGTIIKLVSNTATITIKKDGNLKNVMVRVNATYTGTAVLVRGETGFEERLNLLDGVVFWDEGAGSASVNSRALLIQAVGDVALSAYICRCTFGRIIVYGFYRAVRIYAEEVNAAFPVYINGNHFGSIIAVSQGLEAVIMEGVDSGAGVVGVVAENVFDAIIAEPRGAPNQTMRAVVLAGAGCIRNDFLWIRTIDWAAIAGGNALVINALVTGTHVAGGYLEGIADNGTGSIIRHVAGAKFAENSGTATVAAAAVTIVVAHGLYATPTRVFVSATLWGLSTKAWVTAIGAANFTINVDVVPGAGGAIFDWKAQVGEG